MQEDLENSAGVRAGDVIAGKYRIERILGVGGMGVVVAAHHLQLDEKVAIKFLLPTMLANQDVVGRFAREARAAVRIKSEHVARVSDVGTLDNGAPYMVMEFLDGGDLAAWLHRHGPLPIEQAVDFVLQACVAVADAHSLRIVHRDLKPANLFCVRRSDGQFVIKVLDFGISKTGVGGLHEGTSGTKTAAVMGSPLYMSPEQMQSAKDVDGQTDIWALGIILYELLTGATPFGGDSFVEIAIKVATVPPAPLRQLRPDAPAKLEAVLLKCLERDKKRRYGNVAELAVALAAFGPRRSHVLVDRITGILQASGVSANAGVSAPATETGRSAHSGTMTAFEPARGAAPAPGTMAPSSNTAPGAPRRSRAAVIGVVVGGLSVAALVGFVAWGKRQTVADIAPAAMSNSGAASVSPQATTLVPLPSKVEPRVVEPPAAEPPVGNPSAANPSAAYKSVESTKPVPPPARPPVPGTAGLRHPSPPSTPAPATGAKPNCTPNFTWGPSGNKIFKPECF